MQKKAKNKKINIADIAIIAVALICIVGAVIRISHSKNGRYLKDETYKITFTASGLTADDTAKLTAGIRFRTGGVPFGTLAEGYWTEPEKDSGAFTLKAAVISSGIITETGFLSDGTLYRKGDTVKIESGKLTLTATLTGFEKAE